MRKEEITSVEFSLDCVSNDLVTWNRMHTYFLDQLSRILKNLLKIIGNATQISSTTPKWSILTASNKAELWVPLSIVVDLGEDPSSDSSGTGDGGLAGI